ncbi:T9SS type A sorting domain-containing protein [candidate division KSB1 bacterium]|nr:T9SS type A sorting domain-containing protein [candidate division KSB1 bacterium]
MKILFKFILFFALFFCNLLAQNNIQITFRHYPASEHVIRTFVPGSFNGWGPNSNGVIDSNAPSRMKNTEAFQFYYKTYTLQTGQTEQYKFHEHFNDGSPGTWLTDPLNPNINTQDNDNSVLNVQEAMIFEVYPSAGSVLTDTLSYLTAGIFISDADALLQEVSSILIDGEVVSSFTGWMIDSLSILHYQMRDLENGLHTAFIHAETENGLILEDSTQFTFRAGEIFFITPSHDSILTAEKTIRWQVSLDENAIQSLKLVQLAHDPVLLTAETGIMDYSVQLYYGVNSFMVELTDTSGTTFLTDTLLLEFPEPQDPVPSIHFSLEDNQIRVTGSGGDPQGNPVQYMWMNQSLNPEIISNLESQTDSTFLIDLPSLPGDYAIRLDVVDDESLTGHSVQFFSVMDDLSVMLPESETIPLWVHDARIYCMFVRSYTNEGTLQAATENLEHIRDMGFSVIWVIPIMDVEGVVDQGVNIGYNIIDFFNVEPFYGSNQDFKDFVEAAHEIGLRVIMDVTPNHSSRSHPIAQDVRSNQLYSRYYDFYQHEIIPHNDMGLGQSVSSDGIVYYSAFSDALLNWNYSDAEARQYMINVYRHWLAEYDIDGFRFDVYWGPNHRYGRDAFDRPLRNALRALKSDILLLGEAPGTGVGSELIYADQSGGVDISYDWNLNGALQGFPSVSNLHTQLLNGNYRPGPNSLFLRFLENQDEERVAYRYDSIEKTIPVSTAIFAGTGLPMIFQGQEVGMGYGMGGGRDFRVRSTVDWDNSPVTILAPHYQKLAQIRSQFPAFRRQFEDSNEDGLINSGDLNIQDRLLTSNSSVYAMARPFLNQNGLAVMNFSSTFKSVDVYVDPESWMEFSPLMRPIDLYYLNDLYRNTSTQILGSDLDTLQIELEPYGISIFTISLSPDSLILPELAVRVQPDVKSLTLSQFRLYPNYPNPFNAGTMIQYDLPKKCDVQIRIIDILGRRVRKLHSGQQIAGHYEIRWDGKNDDSMISPSGLYIVIVKIESYIKSRKICLIR